MKERKVVASMAMGMIALGVSADALSSPINVKSIHKISKYKDKKKLVKAEYSEDMKVILERLEYDWEFIGKFLDAPEKVVRQFKLNKEEKNALVARDVSALMKLGLSEEEVSIAMSGTHRGGNTYGR